MGFLVICAGVVILQLSKSAKDVPDAAVFAGDLDQVRTIAEQEQPESEPKADAIRGAAAIVRRFSQARQKMEMDEARRLYEEKQMDLAPIGENEQIEWDGLRRRRTTLGSNPRGSNPRLRTPGENSTPFPQFEAIHTPTQHPPLGMSRFPDESDSDHDEERPRTGGLGSSFFGSMRERAKSINRSRRGTSNQPVQSPMHPVPLTEIAIPVYKGADAQGSPYYGHDHDDPTHTFGLPAGLREHKTEYEGAGGEGGRHVTIEESSGRTGSRGSSLHPDSGAGPVPPPHSARRQFSFQNVFRKGQGQAIPQSESEATSPPHSNIRPQLARKGLSARRLSHVSPTKGATEEERLGLVKGDTRSGREPVDDVDNEDDDEEEYSRARQQQSPERRDLTTREKGPEQINASVDENDEDEMDPSRRPRLIKHSQQRSDGSIPPVPPPHDDSTLGRGAGRSGGGAGGGMFV